MILVKSEEQTVDSSAQLHDGSPTVGLRPPRPPSELGEPEGLPSQSHLGTVYLFPLGDSGPLSSSFRELLVEAWPARPPGEPASASLARSS